jgi:hypothetical protein
LEVVADVDDADGHLRGDDDRVVFGPGANLAGQRDDVVFGVRTDVALVGDQRGAVQGFPDVQVDVDLVGGVGDIDVVADVEDTRLGRPRCQPRAPRARAAADGITCTPSCFCRALPGGRRNEKIPRKDRQGRRGVKTCGPDTGRPEGSLTAVAEGSRA